MSRSNSIVKQASILALAGILVSIIGLLYRSPLTAMILDEGNGYYSTAYNIYALVLLISSYSIPTAISKLISEKIALKEYKNVKRIYGIIRFKKHIENKFGIILNYKLIRRYKHILGIITVKRTKKGLSVSRAKEKNLTNKAQYLIECNFNSDVPNQKYSSDVSYIKCKDGTLYLSAIKDYFNTEIVTFSTSNNNDVKLIKESYKDLKPIKDAVVNTDQGAVYFAYEYIDLANNIGFTRSMSHRGHCWENCPIENWFMQLKHEWLCQFGKLTKKQATEEIKKYVHWYNNERIQKKLGYLSPVQYRIKYSKNQIN